MPVMAAGMHGSGDGRSISPALDGFRHGERVHVGAQSDAAVAIVRAQWADDAGFAKADMHVETEFPQSIRDNPASADLLETEFGMGTEIAPQLDQILEPSGAKGCLCIIIVRHGSVPLPLISRSLCNS